MRLFRVPDGVVGAQFDVVVRLGGQFAHFVIGRGRYYLSLKAGILKFRPYAIDFGALRKKGVN
jgi:hypothetical protein